MSEPLHNPKPLRIGHDERNAAIAALDEHLRQGRLDVDEYGDRMATASLAVTRPELEVLFLDLPAPHPFAGPPAFPQTHPTPWAGAGYVPIPQRRHHGGAVSSLVRAILAVALIVAAVSFVTSFWWLFFCLPWLLGSVQRRSRQSFGWGQHSYRR